MIKVAKQSIGDIFKEIKKAVKETSDNINLTTWLQEFHGNLNGAVEITLSTLTDVIGDKALNSCKYFCKETELGLNKQEEEMKTLLNTDKKFVSDLQDTYAKAADLLFEFLSGCTEQCPFCNEYCKMSVHNHLQITGSEFHSICIHRPQCLARFRNLQSGKLVIDICTSLIGSDDTFSKGPFSVFHIKTINHVFQNRIYYMM